MTAPLCFLIPLIVLAVVLDLFFVTGLHRFRKLKKAYTDQDEVLQISKRELLLGAFFKMAIESDPINNDIQGLGKPIFSRRTLARFTTLWQSLTTRVHAVLPSRWFPLLIGIGCISYSQFLIEQRIVQPSLIAYEWNILYRLDIVNLSNVLYAVPYFVGGVFLCAWAGFPPSWDEPFVNWASHWTFVKEMKWDKQIRHLLAATGLTIFLLVQLDRHQYAPMYPFLWVVVLWLFTLVVWNWDRENHINLSLELHPTDILWMFGIFVLGIGVTAFALEDIPAVIVPDEMDFWETAQAIAVQEYRPVFFDSGVYTFPVVSSIYQGWIMRWFGVDLWGWRFSSVLAGVAALIPLYLLAKEWFGRRVAIASAILMLANPYFLVFSRLGYNNSQSLFPVTLAIYFWALGSRKGSHFYLWLAGLTAGLGFYTYSATWIGLVTLFLGVVYLRVLRQVSWKQGFSVLVLILLAWVVAFGPRIAYATSGNAKEELVFKILETSFFHTYYGGIYYDKADLSRTTPIIESEKYPSIFYDPLVYQELLTRGAVRTVVALFNPYIISEHFLISPLTGVISPIFFAIGCILFLRKWKQSRCSLPLIWLVSGMVFLSVIGAFPPRHTHMVSLIPVMALISGAGVSAVIETLTEYLPGRINSFRHAIINVLITMMLITILYAGTRSYFVTMPNTYHPPYDTIEFSPDSDLK